MKKLKIVVCVKQIPDPEAPLGSAKIDSENNRMDVSLLRQVINPFDENALEAALRLKDEVGGEVTVLNVGYKSDASVLRKVLAVGADRLILLDDPSFEDADTLSTAHALSQAVNKLEGYDLILAGRQAGDWDAGQTGIVLGEMLGIPTVNLARSVRIENHNVLVEKIVPDGYEEVEAALPALVTVSNEVGGLRFPSMKMILLSRRHPVENWKAEEADVRSEKMRKQAIEYFLPSPDMTRLCEFIEGASPEEKGQNLARILRREFG